jgi:MFS family permease
VILNLELLPSFQDIIEWTQVYLDANTQILSDNCNGDHRCQHTILQVLSKFDADIELYLKIIYAINYSYAIVNPVQQLMQTWINQTYIDRTNQSMSIAELDNYWSFLVSSIAIGAIVGSMLAGYLARFGPKYALILNALVNIAAALCEGTAKSFQSPELLIVGRIILGTNIGKTHIV